MAVQFHPGRLQLDPAALATGAGDMARKPSPQSVPQGPKRPILMLPQPEKVPLETAISRKRVRRSTAFSSACYTDSDATNTYEARMIPDDLGALFLRDDFFFVQVGANDGVLDDPLHEFILKHDLHGVLIEPLPWAFARLKCTYAGHTRLTLLHTAISDREGTLELWCLPASMSKSAEWDLSVLATTRRHLFTHRLCLDPADAEELAPHLIQVVVPCTTLNALVAACGIAHIDLLQIDTQGHDYEVLRSIDLSRTKPAYINFEHVLLEERESQCRKYLESNGYRLLPGIDERYDTLAVLRS